MLLTLIVIQSVLLYCKSYSSNKSVLKYGCSYCFSLNRLMPTKLQMVHSVPSKAAIGAAAILLSLSPIGNLETAFKAASSDPNSISCTLDTQNSDEYHDSCQLLPYVVRIRAGKVLTFKQDWGSSSSTGATIWNGANVVSKFLENNVPRELIKGSKVIELGAGVGFGGVVAHVLGATEVAITDGSEEVLKLANDNIKINCDPNINSKIYTGRLLWNTDDDQLYANKQWDYILASDVTYLKKNRHDLIASIVHLSGPTTVTYLSMEPRSVDEVADTLHEVNVQGLQWVEESLTGPGGLVDAKKSGCNLQCARIFALRKPALAVTAQ